MAISLTILPGPRVLDTKPGTTILKAAHAGGVDINAICGGRGPLHLLPGQAGRGHGAAAHHHGRAAARRRARPRGLPARPASGRSPRRSPCRSRLPLDDTTFQILGGERPAGAPAPVSIDAGIRKRAVQVTLPKDEHLQTSDLEALLAATGRRDRGRSAAVLKTLPAALRDRDGEVTVTTFGRHVLAVEAGDTALHKYGLAIDIGTTSVVTTLMELESGEQLASASSLNPQAVFGGDLMSRIAFAQFDPGNLRKLQTRIIGLLNQHIEQIARESGVLAKWIYKVVVVGNTCMHHLLLGIDPSYVGLAPYAPVMRHPLTLPARDLFLKLPPEARVCLLPIVAGFVGADAVAVALATRMDESPALRIAVDIGTNGEVLLGSRERLWACSAPAGPALEGAQIRHGMRAAIGAIDRVSVEDGDLRLHTIGDGPAQGLCGSGLVDAVAALLDLGVVDWTGLIDVDGRDRLPAPMRSRVEMRGEERVVVLARARRARAPSGRSCSPRTTSGRCSSARAPSPPGWRCCGTSRASGPSRSRS